MTSLLQNRLAGIIILVALGIIILPTLLDGKKKHYEDKFTAIPLMPEPKNIEKSTILPSIIKPLPVSQTT